MKLPPLDYICPATLTEAIAALAVHGGNAKVIAGGQSLMPMLAFRLAAPSVLVDIGRLPDLKSISISAEGIDIGALVTWRDIERDARSHRRIHYSRRLSPMSRITRSVTAAPSAGAWLMPIRPPKCRVLR
jgi:CO/xanthine dehydrogenase FAD-binding subunit